MRLSFRLVSSVLCTLATAGNASTSATLHRRGLTGSKMLESELELVPFLDGAGPHTASNAPPRHGQATSGSTHHLDDRLDPLNGIENVKKGSPWAPRIEAISRDPLRHYRAHQDAADAFLYDATTAEEEAQRLAKLRSNVPPLRALTQGRRIDRQIRAAKAAHQHATKIQRQHIEMAEKLARPRPVSGEFRGLPLPHMTPKEETEYLRLVKEKSETTVHRHLIKVSDRRRVENMWESDRTRDGLNQEEDPDRIFAQRNRLIHLHEGLQKHEDISKAHRAALEELTGRTLRSEKPQASSSGQAPIEAESPTPSPIAGQGSHAPTLRRRLRRADGGH